MENIQDYLTQFIGRIIDDKTITGNSIEIWFGDYPDRKKTKCFWIDSPWRIEYQGEIEASSADFFPGEKEEHETEQEYEKRFEHACSQSDRIKQSRIEDIKVDTKTKDLVIALNNNRDIRSFTVWKEDIWSFYNHEENRVYYVSIDQIRVKEIN